jgi:hypothetical protein
MAFTYTEDLTVNSDFVRFHTGDTVESESILSDAIITSLLATETDKYHAVIAGLRYRRDRMLQPDFRADWLSETNHLEVAKMIDDIIRRKQQEFGLSQYTATVTYTYRADSSATEEPYAS